METYAVPGMELSKARPLAGILQERLNACYDLARAKHKHRNVVGLDSPRYTQC